MTPGIYQIYSDDDPGLNLTFLQKKKSNLQSGTFILENAVTCLYNQLNEYLKVSEYQQSK